MWHYNSSCCSIGCSRSGTRASRSISSATHWSANHQPWVAGFVVAAAAVATAIMATAGLFSAVGSPTCRLTLGRWCQSPLVALLAVVASASAGLATSFSFIPSPRTSRIWTVVISHPSCRWKVSRLPPRMLSPRGSRRVSHCRYISRPVASCNRTAGAWRVCLDRWSGAAS